MENLAINGGETPIPSAEDVIYGFQFTGRHGEYFKIWLVNILLTILTLGAFSAWAKVRARRYFYANTYLNGANFEYDAKPLSILLARIVVLLIFAGGAIWAGEDLVRNAAHSVLLIVLVPWATVRGLAFNARYSSYRHIRFRFNKTPAVYLKVYLIYMPGILLVLAYSSATFIGHPSDSLVAFKVMTGLLLLLILLAPWWAYKYRRWQADRREREGQSVIGQTPAPAADMLMLWGMALLGAIMAFFIYADIGGLFWGFSGGRLPVELIVMEGMLFLCMALMPWRVRAVRRRQAANAGQTDSPSVRPVPFIRTDMLAFWTMSIFGGVFAYFAFIAAGLPFSTSILGWIGWSPLYALAGVLFFLIILMPWLTRAYHGWKAGNHGWGGLSIAFEWPSIGSYLIAFWLIPILAVIFISFIFFGIGAGSFGSEEWDEWIGVATLMIALLICALAFCMLSARLFCLYWEGLVLAERCRLVCDFTPTRFGVNILLVNYLLIIFSLGLLYPYTKIRKGHFLARHMVISAPPGTMDEVQAARHRCVGALGEEFEAVEGFDFDVGLI